MRLINTYTLELKEFFESEVPRYAILSHTWEEDEVSLQEMEQQHHDLEGKRGYRKIEYACLLARSSKLDWVWVDTCCIDKKSSAELTEAINSMFRWYQQASVCYAYLSDWEPVISPHDGITNFSDCRWFTRGWTLQELIAPSSVKFYDRDWVNRGTKASLESEIQRVTGIPEAALKFYNPTRRAFSIAERMSWAANRRTTRREDIAYCLLGLFDINMPMMYGEGDKAFYRLQEQLCRQTSDLTLFAWEDKEAIESEIDNSGKGWSLFAPSPAAFGLPQGQRDGVYYEPGQIRDGRIRTSLVYTDISEYSVANTGLCVEGELPRIWNNNIYGTDSCQGQYYFELGLVQIFKSNGVENRFYSIGITLGKWGPGLFFRKNPHLTFIPTVAGSRDKFRSQATMVKSRFRIYPGRPDIMGRIDPTVRRRDRPLAISLDPTTAYISKVIPEAHWDVARQTFFTADKSVIFAALIMLQLAGNRQPYPVLAGVADRGRKPFLVDYALAGPRFRLWFDQNTNPSNIPTWAEFETVLDVGITSQESPLVQNEKTIVVRGDDDISHLVSVVAVTSDPSQQKNERCSWGPYSVLTLSLRHSSLLDENSLSG